MDDYSDKVLISLRRIIRAVSIYSKGIAARYALTVPQLLLLKEIKRSNRITVSELAGVVNLSSATVSDIVDRLKKKMLIHKRRYKYDRRKVLIFLTEKGEEVLANAPSLLQKRFIDKFKKLKTEEKDDLCAALDVIASMMEEEALEAGHVISGGVKSAANLKP